MGQKKLGGPDSFVSLKVVNMEFLVHVVSMHFAPSNSASLPPPPLPLCSGLYHILGSSILLEKCQDRYPKTTHIWNIPSLFPKKQKYTSVGPQSHYIQRSKQSIINCFLKIL